MAVKKTKTTKNQHFVPRVYLKAWDTTVYSLKEPNKPFTGVYYYDRADLSIGDGRNKETILSENHTYTIDFNYTFILSKCPIIRKEFADKIKAILEQRKVKAYYKGKLLTSRNAISSNLQEVEQWEFYKYDGNLASKKSNINAIKEVRSYFLEDGFDKYVESKWETTLNAFLAYFPQVDGTGEIERHISMSKPILDMLNMVALMMCRNPAFSFFGYATFWKDVLLIPILSQYGEADQAEIIMRGQWLTAIYKGFCSKEGFVSTFVSSAASNFGIVVFRVANKNEGSFITSDNPVVHRKLLVESVNHNGIYFPLTPQYLLFLGKRTDGSINDVVFRTVHNQDVRRINGIILNGAITGIVSTEQHLGHII